MRQTLIDAQAAMSFLVNQASYIEAVAYRTQYPEIIYPQLVPIDESAPEWAKSITFYSIDWAGQARWLNHMHTDHPLADVQRAAFEQGIELAGVGYRYTLEEIGQAMLVGWNLTAERASAAVRAYEEFMNQVALAGDTDKGFEGLISSSVISAGSSSKTWATATADEILADINGLLTSVYVASNTVEIANTLLLPVEQYTLLATMRVPDTTMTVMQWIMANNAYTANTGAPLTIRALRQLNGAGDGGDDRAMAYNRSPDVLRMHVPMRHRFLPVWQTGPITFDVPGIFRTGGVEFRRPAAARYLDGIAVTLALGLGAIVSEFLNAIQTGGVI
jgi:hypothetical protein